jgi:hypothetical protein
MFVNSLSDFSIELQVTVQKLKRKVNPKGLLKTLRRKWKKGSYTDFDELLSETACVDLETASRIRQSWEDLDLLGYDESGYLCWYKGGF